MAMGNIIVKTTGFATKRHVAAILEKLAVHSRTGAVVAAFGFGLAKPSNTTDKEGLA